jgi:hypothetical protein
MCFELDYQNFLPTYIQGVIAKNANTCKKYNRNM